MNRILGKKSYQNNRLAEGSKKMAGGLSLGGILLLVVMPLSTQATSLDGDSVLGGDNVVASFESEFLAPGDTRLLDSLSDVQLESIYGRYVNAQALLLDNVGDEANFVILWDERPTGSGGSSTRSSFSDGAGNQQSTSVTTQREQ